MINPQSVLDVPMQENDAGATTIRQYLIKLLLKVWEETEGFDGKRPFGNSGWDGDLLEALRLAGLIEDSWEEDERGQRLIAAAITSLGWVESSEPAPFT